MESSEESAKAQFKKILGRNLFFPLLLSVGLAAVFLSLTLYQLSVNKWVDHADQVIAQSHKILNLIVDSETGMRGFLLTGEPIFLEPYNNATRHLNEEFEVLRQMRSEDLSRVNYINALVKSYDEWVSITSHRLNAKLKNKKFLPQLSDEERSKAIMDGMRLQIAKVIADEEQIRTEHSEDAANLIRFIFIITLIISALGGLFLAFSGRKELRALTDTYEKALDDQKEQNNILENRNWIAAARTGLNEKIMGDLSIKNISTNALDFLVHYLGAQVGAFFVMEGPDTLERMASYAIEEEALIKSETFKLGEGLVGQAALDGEIKIVNNLPSHYLSLKSSLGRANSNHIVLAPLMNDNNVKGVIELGFLESIDEKKEELLREVTPPLAAGVVAAQYRLRLEELLAESQRMSEELQSQQEELRVSNEELEQNSKMLRETQVRMESQHAELEQTNDQLEEQTRALEERNEFLFKTQTDLAAKSQELEAASQYKSEFLANMSHELRTPLNSTLILAKLLAENASGTLTAEQVEFANTIYASGNDLLNLINDILDLSKVEAGRLEVNIESIPLDNILKNLEKIFKPVAKERKLEFKTEKMSPLPAVIFSDRQRLEQILKNFLSNAFKFTTQGSVSLKVERRGDHHLAFSVKDTGIGISSDQHDIIFEAFRQADGTTSRKYGGTGLGLTISRDLAKLLGGTVELTSEETKGSTFTIVLPENFDQKSNTAETLISAPVKASIKVAPQTPHRAQPFLEDDRSTINATSKTVLIIEDDVHFAKILSDLAKELHFKVLITDSADEAFALALAHSPAAIVLDMKLPDQTGLSVLDKLKRTSKTRHIPVHVLSVEDYSDMALKMGAIGYMIKPLERDNIRKAFQALEAKISQKIKKVLIVEDDRTQLDSMQKLIDGTDVRTTPAPTGADALKKLKSEIFDCVIIDLNLPDMSGFDLLEKMFKEDTGFPPVIVYTGRSLSPLEEEKLRRYSQSVIIKGARSPERLLDEVSLFIHQVESQLPAERQKMLSEVRNREKAFEGRKVLIVDDDVRNIFALTHALELKGVKVETARNGIECLDKLKSTPDIELVLMDLMMPVMDGLTAIKEIRKNNKYSKLSIIAVTAKAMRDDQEKSIEAGANDYLAKPINIEKLLSLVRIWIPKSGWL